MSEFEVGFSGGGAAVASASPTMSAGASRSSGPSMSEGMGKSTGFSSAGIFDKSSFSPRNTSIVDINHGKSNEGMFDISKTPAESPIVPHESSVHTPSIESPSSPIVDIKNGKTEKSSMFKSSLSFDAPTPMFDVSKPSFEDVRPHFSSNDKGVEATEKTQEPVEVSNSGISHEAPVSPFENTVVLWERTQTTPAVEHQVKTSVETPSASASKIDVQALSQPEVRTEIETSVSNDSATLTHPEALPEVRTDVQTIGSEEQQVEYAEPQKQSKTRTEVKTNPATEPDAEHQTLQKMVESMPFVTSKNRTEVLEKAEVADALTQEVMVRTHESLARVRKALVTVIEEEVDEEAAPEVEAMLQEELQTGTSVKASTLEAKAKAIFQERQKEKDKKVNDAIPFPEEPDILNIKKDNEVNQYRQWLIVKATEQASRRGKVATGNEIADIVEQSIDYKPSEIVKGIQADFSADAVVEELRKVGRIENILNAHNVARRVIKKVTAVMLSSDKRSKEDATKTDAERVFDHRLHEVKAHVGELKSKGVIVQEDMVDVHVYHPLELPEIYTIEKALVPAMS